MLNFKNTFTVFFLIIGLGNWLHFAFGMPIHSWYYLVLIILTLGVAAYGSAYICSNYHFKVVCKSAENTKNQIAITFDDGVDPEQTPIILDILNKYNIKATFFCIGNKCSGNEVLVRRIVEEGHIIGNHTFTHSNWFDFFSARKMLKELTKTDEVITRITGKRPFFFRPPYGVTNPALKKALTKSGHLPVGWSIRSFDTNKTKTASDIYKRVSGMMKAGDIILFHDTVIILPEVLDLLISYGKENGFNFVTVEEILNINAYFE